MGLTVEEVLLWGLGTEGGQSLCGEKEGQGYRRWGFKQDRSKRVLVPPPVLRLPGSYLPEAQNQKTESGTPMMETPTGFTVRAGGGITDRA